MHSGLPLTTSGSNLADKGKGSAAADRVPNSGLQSTTTSSNGSSASSVDKPSLVYQLQKINGMEKKRRSRTRRDQPATNKPGQPYQKSHPHPRTNPSTAQQPTSPDPSGRSPSRRKGTSRVSRVEASSSRFDNPPPRTSADDHRPAYSSTTSPSRSSSPSSPYYPSAGTSSSSPGSRNVTPLRASLPMPTPPFDHFHHMALSTPDSLSPSSPGYHELQSYGHELPGDLRLQYHVSQTLPADEPRLATTQFSDSFGPNRSCWNEHDRQQGRFESPIYHRSLASYPPGPSGSVPRLAHRPEQTTMTSSLPPMSHGLGIPPAEHPGGSYFYSDYEDRAAGTSLQNVYLLTDRSSDTDPSTTAPYYS